MLHLSFVMRANEFFSHENQPCPPSLSVKRELKLGTKSDIVRCLEDAPEEQDENSVDVVVLDGLVILCLAEACNCWNFRRIICPLCVPTIMRNINWVKDT